jgi:hypothetical protein
MARNKDKAVGRTTLAGGPKSHDNGETEAQIDARIRERFHVLETLTDNVIAGRTRSLIVSGPAGLGKSYTVEQKLKEFDAAEKHTKYIKGFVRATGLYKTLYEASGDSSDGNVKTVVFDDADSIFFDDVSLGLLKAVCDTTEIRKVSWLAETPMVTDDGKPMPRNFIFNGQIIFITNIDFDELCDREHALTPHLKAMMSRSHYIDLSMKSYKDYLVRIHQVMKEGLLKHLPEPQQIDVMKFIDTNYAELRELSLRMAIKIAELRAGSDDWEKIARITCMRQRPTKK